MFLQTRFLTRVLKWAQFEMPSAAWSLACVLFRAFIAVAEFLNERRRQPRDATSLARLRQVRRQTLERLGRADDFERLHDDGFRRD